MYLKKYINDARSHEGQMVLRTYIFIYILSSLHREFTIIYLEQTKSLD